MLISIKNYLRKSTLYEYSEMCGLWAYFVRSGYNLVEQDFEEHSKWAHASSVRGPDRCSEVRGARHHMVFHRLAIHDMSMRGDQPFYSIDGRGVPCTVMCNGEIYNYKELIQKYNLKMTSSSDCEVILRLLILFRYDVARVLKEIKGEFAFVARIHYARGRERIIAARDPFGVRPLYFAQTKNGLLFSSVLEGIDGFNSPKEIVKGHHLPPGVWVDYSNRDTEMHSFYDIRTQIPKLISENEITYYQKQVTDAFIEAVRIRLDSDRPVGFLLSGGLDSSLVVAVASKIIGSDIPLNTFSIGMSDSPDIEYANMVAKHCNTKHTVVPLEPQKAFKEIDNVIRHIESFDITTVRASTPQYILAKYISEETNIKVILNGDGADEVEAGYLYFHKAPSPNEMHDECIRLLREIHMYDGLRVDRTLGAHGLEARIPFLDPNFVETYLAVPAELRIPTADRKEKQFIRDAFATLYPDILPKEVLYRTKDAFSDGVSKNQVGTSWYEMIQGYVNEIYTDAEYELMKSSGNLWTETKEAAYYLDVFLSYLPNQQHILKEYWMPKWTTATDPSARTYTNQL